MADIVQMHDILLRELAARVESKLVDLVNLNVDPATVGRSGTTMVQKGAAAYAFNIDLDLRHAEQMTPERRAEVLASLVASGQYSVDADGRLVRV